jgi:hypothetical protein
MAENPKDFVLERRNLRTLLEANIHRAEGGKTLIPLGGHHQHLLTKAAQRAQQEIFLLSPQAEIRERLGQLAQPEPAQWSRDIQDVVAYFRTMARALRGPAMAAAIAPTKRGWTFGYREALK